MKFKYKIKTIVKTKADVLERKIDNYLIKNSYRITERGLGYVIFVEDEFSDRRKSRSDFYTRIGEGKFVFSYLDDHETSIELIYLTSVSYYIVLVMLVCAFGVYTNTIIISIVTSLLLTTPFLYKIGYLNMNVFKEIMEC